MIFLSGADIVLPDRILGPGTLAIDNETIVDIGSGSRSSSGSDTLFDLTGHLVVPGFIDVHVHGVEGTDTLDGDDAIRTIAERLPRFGVTAFCPTSIACRPAVLRTLLTAVRRSRSRPSSSIGARVLPAHLESNFISPEYKGAQPLDCLRLPRGSNEGEFTGAQILDEIAAARDVVGILTIAPELDGAIDLIRDLVDTGITCRWDIPGHLRGSPGRHRSGRAAGHASLQSDASDQSPQAGLAGAVLGSEEITAEVVCDGVHVHPSMVRLALSAKRPSISWPSPTAPPKPVSPAVRVTTIGGRPITVGDAALLDDGTLAGSVLTMDRAFS
jgi:N-acetylglucosamine-6-phosphate deacetylase